MTRLDIHSPRIRSLHPRPLTTGLNIGIAFMVTLAAATSAPAQTVRAKDAVIEGMSEPVRAWAKAVEAGDAKAIADMNAPDTVAYPIDAMVVRGGQAVATGYAAMFEKYRAAVTIEEPRYIATSDVIHSWGLFTLKLEPRAGGAPMSINGRFSDISVKRADGKWRYLMDHASVPYMAPAAR